MSNRIGIVVALLLLAGAGGLFYLLNRPTVSTVAQPVSAGRPNIVLIVVDTLRADRIDALRADEAVMPQLSAWAKGSWTFTQGHTSASWTKPAVTSILTGMYPETHQVQFGVRRRFLDEQRMQLEILPERLESMAEWLAKAGYRSFGVQGNHHIQPDYGFNQGFEQYVYQNGIGGALSDTALSFIKDVEEPFFVYIQYMDPHAPYTAPDAYQNAFGPLPELSEPDTTLVDQAQWGATYYIDQFFFKLGLREERDTKHLSESGREYIRHLYDRECRYTDDVVHDFMERIRAKDPNTIFILTSDHGEEFWEHDSVGHSKTVYQELLNVPFIIEFPNTAPLVSHTPVETIDILPTLSEYLGLSPNPFWQGRSLLMARDGLEERPVFGHTRGSFPELGLYLQSVRHDGYKLVKDFNTDQTVFYHLDSPSGEQETVDNPEKEAELLAILDEHRAAMLTHPATDEGPEVITLEDDDMMETIRALEAIGYIGFDEEE